MAYTLLICLASGIIIALTTVRTNNSFKVKRNIKYCGCTVATFIIVTLLVYFKTKTIPYVYIDMTVLVLCLINVVLLDNQVNNLDTKTWYKARTFETKLPSNQDIIDKVSVIVVNGEELMLTGNVYSNKFNIVIDSSGNVENEIYEYDMPLIQEFIIFSCGMVYMSLSNIRTLYTVMGALFLMCAVGHYISYKATNSYISLFTKIIYSICLCATLSLCILVAFNKV